MENRRAVLEAAIRCSSRCKPSAFCGSAVHCDEHGRIGSCVVDQLMIIGHEAAGFIVATSAGVNGRSLGDHVALEPGVLQALRSVAGRYILCRRCLLRAPPVDAP